MFILFNYFKKLNLNNNFTIVYPSSFCTRNFFRGYEHSYLIAKEFSELSNFILKKDIIKKTRYTKPQYKAKNKKALNTALAINIKPF